MLSDLKGCIPAPSRPRSSTVADFVASPKRDGDNYLSLFDTEGDKRLYGNMTGLPHSGRLRLMDEITRVI